MKAKYVIATLYDSSLNLSVALLLDFLEQGTDEINN